MNRPLHSGAALVTVAVLALALASCGDRAGADSSSRSEPVSTTRVDLPPSYRFEPEAIVVMAGARVTWTNSDNFTHSIQFDGDPSPGAVISPGASTSRSFDQPGTFHYVCTFHPNDMEGTVEVTAASGSENP